MKSRCAVPNCPSISSASSHKFPRERETAERWRAAVNSPKLIDIPWNMLWQYVVCYRHFDADCFGKGKQRKRILHKSVPTLNLPNNIGRIVNFKKSTVTTSSSNNKSSVIRATRATTVVAKRKRVVRGVIPRCVVPGCKATTKLLAHHFPHNQRLAKKWRDLVKSPKLTNVPLNKLNKFMICELHFTPQDYYTTWRRRLLKNSVPSQNLNLKHLASESEASEGEENDDKFNINSLELSANNNNNSNNSFNKEDDEVTNDDDDDDDDVDIKPVVKYETEEKVEKLNPQNYLMAIEKAVTKMIHRGLLNTDRKCLEPRLHQHRSQVDDDKLGQMRMKIESLELELNLTRKTLQSYQMRVKDANEMMTSDFFKKWMKLKDEQKKIVEILLMNMNTDDSEVVVLE